MTSDLIYVGTASIGGSKAKTFWTDEENRLWLFRENRYLHRPYRPLTVEVYYQFAKQFIDSLVETFAIELPIADKKNHLGTLEKILFLDDTTGIMWSELNEEHVNRIVKERKIPSLKEDLAAGRISMQDFTPSQIERILSEMVIDWLFSNHDSTPANFLINTLSGELFGIDKDQSFKYFTHDRLDMGYLPNGIDFIPLANMILEWLAACGRLSIQLIDAILTEIELFPDGELERIIEPFARKYVPAHTYEFREPGAVEKFLTVFFNRKHSLRKDFEQFFQEVNKSTSMK